ncbi:DUF309 domain-containing protein [Lysinibacillus sphaericus]|uniref:DUF309 domain-containing protein n=3 Tax=Lysinibacillus TaxID=400634 RepID=W7S990_LYSSH|nr:MULTISPECIES: DUF309 domain-containing protein [Lysinibacillus]MBE5085295.1 DUF309 domain-containing protein [Bacillus thuringiensis]ACA39314.1 Hypothetical ypuF protein [Lysinibacillus sphaericus C3-41]AMO34487.1 hypothetical protein AR327_19695 [Lysinibacillus sphaericus]AMR90399.1 hypothetical protein A1T07_09515 [Lysinibacillus sphaericus]ANA44449.1 hypothetical protein A2J09_02185 [Lysinibacillus sphaericus]
MHPQHHTLFIDYCAYFNGNQDFFECHEVLEEYWKEIAYGDKMHPLVGYVQLATGLYHWRRGNDTGAIRILEKALYNFQQNEDHIFFHEISYYQLLTEIKNCLAAIQTGKSFHAFQLPLSPKLLELTIARIQILPYSNSNYLLHKHMLRDRSHILAERQESKQRKGRR